MVGLYLTEKGHLVAKIFKILDQMLEEKMITEKDHVRIIRAILRPPT